MIQKMLEGVLNQVIPALANGVAGIFNQMGGGGGGWLSGLFGGGGGAGFSGDFWDFMYSGGAYHAGGVVYAHAGWPRLRSDEVPIIAQTGERVLSRDQNRAYEAGGTPIQINLEVINNTGNPMDARAQMNGPNIQLILENMMEQSIRGGKAHRALRQTFGLLPQTTAR